MKKYYLAKIDVGLNEYDYHLVKAKSKKKAFKKLRKLTNKYTQILKTIK